jgi:putative protease
MGVARVTLSRETSLGELGVLSAVGREVGVEVESFVHGALCVCYSGQCLLSSMVGGRSANRGLCAQPCRLPYTLEDEAGKVLADDAGSYLLSPKDLAAIGLLPNLIAAGVDSLKIEGRMKSAEYVALVTGVYRAALDRAALDPEAYAVRDGELSVLAEAFSRGFTEAYLAGERGNEMMSYARPNNRGVQVGRVAEAVGGRATIALTTTVDAEDTLEFWTSHGRFAQPVGPIDQAGRSVRHAPAGGRATISVQEPVAEGDRVFRVRNAELASAAARLYADPLSPKLPLSVSVRAVIGAPLEVTVTDTSGRLASACGPVIEPARTKALSADEIAEHVGRFGGTPYEPTGWEIELSPGAGAGFSALHRVRRDALEAYRRTVLAPWAGRRAVGANPPVRAARGRKRAGDVRLAVATADVETAELCLAAGADEAHVPAWQLAEARAASGIVPYTGRISHDREYDAALAPARAAGRAVAGTLGALWRLAGEHHAVEAHWSLNAMNAHATELLGSLGARLVWLSPELSLGQVAEVVAGAGVACGVAVAGRQELMVTEHCVLMAQGPCDRRCSSCVRRTGRRWLRDRKGYRFPMVTDALGRTHLYNAVRLDVTASLVEVLETGVRAVRVDLETETADDAVAITRRVRAALGAARSGVQVARPEGDFTTGHFFRGVR